MPCVWRNFCWITSSWNYCCEHKPHFTKVSWIQRLNMRFQISFSWLAIKHGISTLPLPVLAHQLGTIQDPIWTFLSCQQQSVSSTLNQTRTSSLFDKTSSKNKQELFKAQTHHNLHDNPCHHHKSLPKFLEGSSNCNHNAISCVSWRCRAGRWFWWLWP